MGKVQETVLEIDLDALEHNYWFLRNRLQPTTYFLGVVKAFAYGSDAERIALKLQDLGVDYLAVAYVQEGVALRDAGVTKPILVLHPQSVNFDTLITRCLEPSIYSRHMLTTFLDAAKKHDQRNYPIHLKFNTGLNRLGFLEKDIEYLGEQLKTNKNVRAVSLFSHLAASEDLRELPFTKGQISTFKRIGTVLDSKLGYSPFRHLLNTSGIINYPDAQFQMVRSGIGLYGFGNEAQVDARLRPVASLKTIISQIHQIGPGESVGYNRAFVAAERCTIATLPLGHADGIGRIYGNGSSYVLVHDQKAFIVGNVCMDMIMINVTGIECKEGDEVTIFGKNPTAEAFAARANTISYELLTGISQRVKRRFLDN